MSLMGTPGSPRAEGVTLFRADHVAQPLTRGARDVVPVLLAWRTLLFRMNGIGQSPSRYDGAGFGNLSLRLGPFPGERGRRAHLITGTQTGGRVSLTSQDVSEVVRYDHRANTVWSRGPCSPSSESMTHGAIYDLDPAIRAVFHVHCPEIFSRGDALRLPATRPGVEYGTPEMAREVNRLRRDSGLMDRRCLVMTGHEDGVIAFGRTADEAGHRLLSLIAQALSTPAERSVSKHCRQKSS